MASRLIVTSPPSQLISDLEALFNYDAKPAHAWLLDTPTERIERLRPYQRQCILAVDNAVIIGLRQLLVAMATGTGKTFVTVALLYRLLESKLVRRILFLVDRKALAAQAVREFSSFNTPQGNKFIQEYELYSQRFQKEDFGDDAPFDPKVLPNEYLTDPKPSHTFVYVSTIQRMARNLFGAEGCFAQREGTPNRRTKLTASIFPSTPSISSSPMNATAAIPPRNSAFGATPSTISTPSRSA